MLELVNDLIYIDADVKVIETRIHGFRPALPQRSPSKTSRTGVSRCPPEPKGGQSRHSAEQTWSGLVTLPTQVIYSSDRLRLRIEHETASTS